MILAIFQVDVKLQLFMQSLKTVRRNFKQALRKFFTMKLARHILYLVEFMSSANLMKCWKFLVQSYHPGS